MANLSEHDSHLRGSILLFPIVLVCYAVELQLTFYEFVMFCDLSDSLERQWRHCVHIMGQSKIAGVKTVNSRVS